MAWWDPWIAGLWLYEEDITHQARPAELLTGCCTVLQADPQDPSKDPQEAPKELKMPLLTLLAEGFQEMDLRWFKKALVVIL